MDIRQAAVNFEAVKIGMRQTKEGYILQLAIHPNEVPNDLITSWVGTRYVVALVELNDADEPVAGKDKSEGQKAVAAAGELCRNGRFIKWVDSQAAQSISTEADAVAWLHHYLGIDSRRALETDQRARKAFFDLREEFIQAYRAGQIDK